MLKSNDTVIDIDIHTRCSDSSDLFFLLLSTAMPIPLAAFGLMPALLSSSYEKPRPGRTRELYLIVGHRTMGRSAPTGRGASLAALSFLLIRRLSARAGWLNHVFTNRCQSL
jgi:hypothetical protein